MACWVFLGTVSGMPPEQELFTQVFKDTVGKVRAYLLRRASAQDVDDLVSEVYRIAWSRRDVLPKDALPWLYVTSRNVLNNHYRASGKLPTLTGDAAVDFLNASAPSSEDEALASMRVRGALEALEQEDRELLLLSVWEGLSGLALASASGVPFPVLSVRLHRTKKQFEREWVRLGGDSGGTVVEMPQVLGHKGGEEL
jgi:RNA polymerase sigma-70 factor (ECF subfamily)